MNAQFTLERSPRGRLILTLADGSCHHDVLPVRAFPLTAPDEFVALVSALGQELVSIDRLDELPAATQQLLLEALAPREFVPRILGIEKVSTFSTPSVWTLQTDRGPTQLTLKAEEDIRRLPGGRLLITDNHGLQFMVEDQAALDPRSRRTLERFL
ncbi:MAG: DUF1854 domain-containing protein [Gammaproteobacteria bacterium]|nr:DUF1854 domain-containing protein [Gammaproteobacteria bacterium]